MGHLTKFLRALLLAETARSHSLFHQGCPGRLGVELSDRVKNYFETLKMDSLNLTYAVWKDSLVGGMSPTFSKVHLQTDQTSSLSVHLDLKYNTGTVFS